MRNTALKTAATLCIMLALMMNSIVSYAQTSENMNVDIPFQFSVGGKTLSPGRYTVKRNSQFSSAYIIQSRDGGDSVIVLTIASLISDRVADRRAKLVFNAYGNRHFLSQLWMPSRNTGNHIPQSKAERRLKQELASTNVEPRQIALLAR